jgi:hypothetical protein
VLSSRPRRNTRALAATLFLIAAGCAPRTTVAPVSTLLIPTTDLGTIAVDARVAPPKPSVASLVALGVPGRGRRAADLDAIRATLRRVVTEIDVIGDLRERTIRVGREQTHERFVFASSSDFDTLLELALGEIGLVRRGPESADGATEADPPLTLVLEGRVRLVRRADGVELLNRRMTYESDTKAFTVWTANDAREFRSALAPAIEALAAQIVDEVF